MPIQIQKNTTGSEKLTEIEDNNNSTKILK